MRADVQTLLPLDTYAQIMSISPAQFNRLRFPSISPEPFFVSAANANKPLWYQFDWQAPGQLSIDTLARTIQTAERDIESFLGYSIAPNWISQEVHQYPREYRPDFYGNGLDVRGQMKTIRTKRGRVIAAGRRATTLLGTPAVSGASLVYTDPNGDGWDTLATITVPTTLTNVDEIKLYFTGNGGDPIWEVRPVKSKAIVGVNVVITVDSWLLVDPDLQNALPTDEETSIDGGNSANYVQNIEVRREFTDFTLPSAQFFWERKPRVGNHVFCPTCTSCAGTGCEVCTLIGQDGCFHQRDVYSGLIVPVPAVYDATDARWERLKWAECREPDLVKVWYYAGEQSERFLRDEVTDPLDLRLARIVAQMATARLTCNFRTNNNVATMVEYWRRDMAESGADLSTIFTPPDILNNPFGTHRGEVEAYRALNFHTERRAKVALIAA